MNTKCVEVHRVNGEVEQVTLVEVDKEGSHPAQAQRVILKKGDADLSKFIEDEVYSHHDAKADVEEEDGEKTKKDLLEEVAARLETEPDNEALQAINSRSTKAEIQAALEQKEDES